MRPAASLLPPSSSLPPIHTLTTATQSQILFSLNNLSEVYFPLPVALDFKQNSGKEPLGNIASCLEPPAADSGYGTGADDDDEDVGIFDQRLASLRADTFEQDFVKRWLAKLIERVDGLSCLTSEGTRQHVLDQACDLLESFYTTTSSNSKEVGEDLADFSRSFSFESPHSDSPVRVRLNDGLAGTSSTDCHDVGLQSWGASIIFSELLCEDPRRFHLHRSIIGTSPRIIELGAGTGLVSLVLGTILPRLGFGNFSVVATDYHPAVLQNLRLNIAANSSVGHGNPVETCLLDWSAPVLDSHLALPVDMLVATDVIYAPEHAILVRNCATRLLTANGIFWLVATVRQNGRFEHISSSAESAFGAADRPRGEDGRRLTILYEEFLNKRNGIGRGDESGYKLLRIGWA